MTQEQIVVDRIRADTPLFLLLGQREWSRETGVDPLLSAMSRRLGKSDIDPSFLSYSDVFCPNGRPVDAESIGWLANLVASIPIPQSLQSIAELPWNGVFTSSPDGRLNSVFRSGLRDVQPVYSPSTNPLRTRSRSRLCIHYLFGALDRTEKEELIPTSRFELAGRRLASNQLLSRLLSQITPLGSLFIEGFDTDDWISTEDLFAVLRTLSPGQVVLCAPSDRLLEDPFVRELVRTEVVIPLSRPLATYLEEARDRGLLARLSLDDETDSAAVFIEGRLTSVPKDLYFRLGESARLLDRRVFSPPAHLSPEARYAAFRQFLGESSISASWESFAHELAFVREYWRQLREEVGRVSSDAGIDAPTVLLHGQSGTGKTVAMGWLAFSVASERRVPVVFVERYGPRPEYNDLDEFCRWAEESGAPCTVIVWDGMLEPEAYQQARRVLASRGRRVVLVGSSYRVTRRLGGGVRLIEAPATLSSAEREGFFAYLKEIDPELEHLLQMRANAWDDSFLVALYRILPATRSQLRSGLAKEALTTEARLAPAVSPAITGVPATELARALVAAGFKSSVQPGDATEVDKEGEASNFIGLVMVPGRLGLAVPFDLLLRASSAQVTGKALRLFRETDLFRWHEDVAGTIVVAPRHSLEAALICQSRIGGAAAEAAVAKKLICGARAVGPESVDPEVDFVVHLASGLGPNGPEGTRYVQHYRDLSDSLSYLREQQSVLSSRLMLQEASLLREWVSRRGKDTSPEAIDGALRKAEQILKDSLHLVGESKANLRHRSNLLVELASIIGTRATKLSQHGGDPTLIVGLFDEVRRTALRARALDPGHHHPLDVELWVARNILEKGNLTSAMRLEIGADVLEAFDIVEESELEPRAAERFLSLKQELGPLLNMSDIEGDAFAALVRAGSAAGYFIRAQTILGGAIPGAVQEGAAEKAALARDYLLSHRDAIARDGRCMRLLVRCWWTARTGKGLFAGERQALPFAESDMRECIGLIEGLFRIGPEYQDVQLRYLAAVLYWQCKEYEAARREWRELQQDTDYSLGARRVVKSHLATSSRGVPLQFHGTVTFLNPSGSRGKVLVEEIRQTIDFFPRDFGIQLPRRGQPIGPFHIAFNFIAPVADPIRHYQQGTQQ